MGDWRVLCTFCWGVFWKEWHSGFWEMVGRAVGLKFYRPGYPGIEEETLFSPAVNLSRGLRIYIYMSCIHFGSSLVQGTVPVWAIPQVDLDPSLQQDSRGLPLAIRI